MSGPFTLKLNPSSPEQSIATVLADLDEDELRRVAVDVIREQRRRLERAQSLFECLQAGNMAQEKLDDVRHDYRMAMLMMRAHHQIASVVIDKLGYVPAIPENQVEH